MKTVVTAHAQNLAALGAFRLPSIRTVIAAETLKEQLLVHDSGKPYNGTMAVSVTEVEDLKTNSTSFVVAFSGDHPGFKAGSGYTRALRTNLQALDRSDGEERFWFASELDKVYSPMHAVSQSFFTQAFSGFDPASAVTIGQIMGRIADFKNLFDASTGGSTIVPVMKKQLGRKIIKPAYYGVIAGALALRMNIVNNADVPNAVREVRNFIKYLKRTWPNETKWTGLARFIEEILSNEQISLIDGPTPDCKFLAFNPEVQGDKNLSSALKAAIEAWGSGPYGRYCAEPKGYAAVRQLNNRSIIYTKEDTRTEPNVQWGWLKGQLAFWYSSEGRQFRVTVVKSPEGAEGTASSGAYMVPCSSCASRSSEMLIGL
jgi:hypothetical protein